MHYLFHSLGHFRHHQELSMPPKITRQGPISPGHSLEDIIQQAGSADIYVIDLEDEMGQLPASSHGSYTDTSIQFMSLYGLFFSLEGFPSRNISCLYVTNVMPIHFLLMCYQCYVNLFPGILYSFFLSFQLILGR